MSTTSGGSGIPAGGANIPGTGIAVEGAEGATGEGSLQGVDLASLEADADPVFKDILALKREMGLIGPQATDAGKTDLDNDVEEQLFKPADIPSPYNANTTPALHKELAEKKEFAEEVGQVKAYAENPTKPAKNNLLTRMLAYQTIFPQGSPTDIIFLVFREAVREVNEAKRYAALLVQMRNLISEKVSAELTKLQTGESQELSEMVATQKEYQDEPNKASVEVEIKEFDLAALDPNGNLAVISSEVKRVGREGLNHVILNIENSLETLRNRGQQFTTMFTNFDQKNQQLFQMLTSVLKMYWETVSATRRNVGM